MRSTVAATCPATARSTDTASEAELSVTHGEPVSQARLTCGSACNQLASLLLVSQARLTCGSACTAVQVLTRTLTRALNLTPTLTRCRRQSSPAAAPSEVSDCQLLVVTVRRLAARLRLERHAEGVGLAQ